MTALPPFKFMENSQTTQQNRSLQRDLENPTSPKLKPSNGTTISTSSPILSACLTSTLDPCPTAQNIVESSSTYFS